MKYEQGGGGEPLGQHGNYMYFWMENSGIDVCLLPITKDFLSVVTRQHWIASRHQSLIVDSGIPFSRHRAALGRLR